MPLPSYLNLSPLTNRVQETLRGQSPLSIFVPTDLPNLFQWCSCKRSPTTLNGSNLSQIDDISGNNNNDSQGTSSAQPLFTNKINNIEVATYDGTSDLMNSSNGFPLGDWSCFVVFKTTDASGSFFSRDNSGFTSVDMLFGIGTQAAFNPGAGKIGLERQDNTPDRVNGVGSVATFDDGNPHVAGFVVNGVKADLYVDNTVVNSTGDIDGIFKGGILHMGAGFNAVPNYAGDIADKVMVQRAINSSEVANLIGFLQSEWGI